MYKIRIFDEIEHPDLKTGWEKIYSHRDYCPQFSYEWNRIWWKHFNNGRTLLILALMNGESIEALAPLMIERNILLSQLKFIGSGLTDFHQVLIDKEVAEKEILDLIFEYLLNIQGIDLINLEQVADRTETFYFLKGHARFSKREMIGCPIINLTSMTWEKYLSKIGKKLRGEWKRRYRMLEEQGNIKLVVIETEGKKRIDLSELFELHVRRWNNVDSESKFNSDKIRAFVSEAAFSMSEIRGYLLLIDDKIISYRLGFVRNKVFYAWNTSFDTSFKKYGVGMILLGLILKDLIESGFERLNFMRGNYNWKRRWMTDDDTIINYQFLSAVTNMKGFFAKQYYLKWKWWLKERLNRLLWNRSFQKLRLKYKRYP